MALVALLAVGAVVTPPAVANEPLPLVSVTPALGGQTFAAGAVVPFEVTVDRVAIQATCPFTLGCESPNAATGDVLVEVGTQNVPGADGSLANDYVKVSNYLTQSDANYAVYRGNVALTAIGGLAAGTYYVQMQAAHTVQQDCSALQITCFPNTILLLSPVYTIQIAGPSQPVTPTPAAPTTPPAVQSIIRPANPVACTRYKSALKTNAAQLAVARHAARKARDKGRRATARARVRRLESTRARLALNRTSSCRLGVYPIT